MHSFRALSLVLWVTMVQLARAHPASVLQPRDDNHDDHDRELLFDGGGVVTTNSNNDNNNNREATGCVKPATPAWCTQKGHGGTLTCVPGVAWFCQWTDLTYGSPAYALTNMTCEGCGAGS